MKKLQLLKTIAGILVLVILLGSCSSNTLPAFSLTKGITENAKKSGTSKDSSWKNNNSTNNNSQNGTDTPQGQGKPDLVVVSLEPGDGMPVKGKWEVWEAETYKNGVIATIKNAGTADINALFKVGVYKRHNDRNVYRYDFDRIGTINVTNLPAGETKELYIDINIPKDSGIGENNYIGLYVDYENDIEETNEDNNKGGYNQATEDYELDNKGLHLLHNHENRPDIVAIKFEPPFSLIRGVDSTAYVTIRNNGHYKASGFFKVAVYMRYNNLNVYRYNSDIIGEERCINLDAGEEKRLDIRLSCSNEYNLNKTWYIGVRVDSGNDIEEMKYESNGEDNNFGGYNKKLDQYQPGELLKTIYYSE